MKRKAGNQFGVNPQIWEMNKNEIEKLIENVDPTQFSTTTEIDWGSRRGQGRRRGGMVLGSMSDVTVQGKKSYPNLFGGLKDTPENIKDAILLSHRNEMDTPTYLKYRAVGLGHDASVLLALKEGDLMENDITRDRAIELAKEHELDRYNADRERSLAAPIKSYDESIKTPNGGWTNGDVDNKRATISQCLASLGNGMPSTPKIFYDWSVKHEIDLEDLIRRYGKKLTKKNSDSDVFLSLMEAVYNDKTLSIKIN